MRIVCSLALVLLSSASAMAQTLPPASADPEATPPTAPTALGQFQLDTITPVPVGALTYGAGVYLRGSTGGTSLEFEVRPAEADFTGVPTNAVSGGGTVGTIVALPPGGAYHWRARSASSSGTSAWVAFGGNAAKDVDFVTGQPPTLGAPDQYENNVPVPVGAPLAGWVIVIKATVADLDGQGVAIEIELRASGQPLMGQATHLGESVAGGSEASVVVPVAAGGWHWQARARDAAGGVSPWTSFGGNPETAPDFYATAPPIEEESRTHAWCGGSARVGATATALAIAAALIVILSR